jgi:hypothetical protein
MVGEIPDDVRRFVQDNIDSIELLHVLLMLRDAADREWSIDDISAELRSSSNSIRRRLEHLRRRRLVAVRGSAFRYDAGERSDALVQRLHELYMERRTSVIDMIFAARPEPLQSFSDAFKIGEPNDDR